MFFKNLVKILSDQGLYGAVIATLVFVGIGYLVTKKGIFNKEINGKLSKFLLDYALPFLCIVAFMQPANAKLGREAGIVIGISAAFYILIGVWNTVIIRLWPKLMSKSVYAKAERLYQKQGGDLTKEQFKQAHIQSYARKISAAQMMVAYASLQFFAVPLVTALKGNGPEAIFNGSATALLQVWNLPYMIGAFSYLKMSYSGEKFSKDMIKPIVKSLLSPMMICLYISATLWTLQFIPQIGKNLVTSAKDPFNFNVAAEGGKQFWAGMLERFTILKAFLVPGVQLISPMAWILIGGSIATSDLKEAVKDKAVWITTIRKLFTVPIFMFLVVIGFVVGGLLTPSTATLLVILGACPPAAVTIVFSVAYKHEHTPFTAQVSSLSTVGCLIALPIWTLLASAAFKALAPVVAA